MPELRTRHDPTRLLVFLAAVFLIKLIVVLQLTDQPLLQPDAGLDTSAYVALAGRVRHGDVLLGPGLYFVSPLYIYFLAGLLAIVDSFTAVRLLQVALGTAAVGLVFAAAGAWFGRRAAWIAAGAAALTGAFTFYESLILQSALDPFLTAAALAALAVGLGRHTGRPLPDVDGRHPGRPLRDAGRHTGSPGARWVLLIAGVAFGLEALNRPNVLVPAMVIVGLLVAVRRVRPAGLVAAGIAVALVPVLARNVAVAGAWSPLPSHGGLNFYIGNNPDADGVYHDVPGITPNIAGQQEDARRVASRALGHEATDAEASSYFLRAGLRWIRAEPATALALFGRKLAYTFNAARIPLNDSYAFYAYDLHTLLAVLACGAWLLVPLGIAGLAMAAPRTREYLVWVSFVPAYAIGVALFFVADRYRLPLLVPMCIGCGAAVDRLATRARRAVRRGIAPPRRAQAAGGAVAIIALVVFANWPVKIDDGRREERTKMAEALAAQGLSAQAEPWAARAVAGSPQPALVEFRVGQALLAGHQPAAAAAHLERAIRLDPHRPEAEYVLGEALLDAGRPGEAVPHLRAAVARGVHVDVAGFDLARALAATGDRAGATMALAQVTPGDPRDVASWMALGTLAVSVDAPDLEERFFSAAVDADPSNATAHLNLAVVLAQRGRIADARRHAAEAVTLNPGYEKARQLLAALDGR